MGRMDKLEESSVWGKMFQPWHGLPRLQLKGADQLGEEMGLDCGRGPRHRRCHSDADCPAGLTVTAGKGAAEEVCMHRIQQDRITQLACALAQQCAATPPRTRC